MFSLTILPGVMEEQAVNITVREGVNQQLIVISESGKVVERMAWKVSIGPK